MDSKLIEILIKAKDDASATLARVGGELQTLDDKQKATLQSAAQFSAVALGLGGVALAGIGAYGLYAAGGMQQTSVSMQNLIGNTQLANQVFGQLAVYANNTPFTFSEISKASQTLLGFGFGGQESVSMIKQMGDVAAASGGKVGDLALVTGQIFSQGKLRAQDLYQVINDGGAGVVKIMAQNVGGMANLTDEFNKGGIPAKQYFDALNQATGKGGFAFEGAVKQADTFNGRLSTLADAATQVAMRMAGVQVTSQGLVIDPKGLFQKATDAALGLINALNGLPAWWGKYGGAVEVIGAGVGSILLGIVAAFVAVKIAALGALIAASPLTWTFILIGAAVVMLGVLIAQHWAQIKDFIGGAVNAIVVSVGTGLNWLKDNWASALGFIIGFVATLPIKLPILMGDAMIGMVRMVGSINWGAVASVIGNAFGAMWDGVKNAALSVWHFITGINWGATLAGIGKGIGNAVIDLIQGAINGAFSGIPGSPKVHLPHFASGVQNFGGGLAVVGERGPELVSLPGGSSVYSNQDSQRMTGGGDVHVHLHAENFLGTPGEFRGFAAKVYQELMRIDRANGTPMLPNIGVRPA